MVVADLKQRVEKGETPEALTMAPAEREARVVAQKTRLTGLMRTGVEEVAFESYNAVYSMLQQNTLVYHRTASSHVRWNFNQRRRAANSR